MYNLNAAGELIDETSATYLGQWNRLVSTTNWDKGRIIHEWREALSEAAAPASEFSDDAWSRRVGNVTGQHVGRLRRVYERFGGVHGDYSGLYWSHFQAAIDWNDAEMWLEGAVQNGWSVADMRRERWQAFGGAPQETPRDEEVVSAEVDEDFQPTEELSVTSAGNRGDAPFDDRSRRHESDDVGGPRFEGPDFGDEPQSHTDSGNHATYDDIVGENKSDLGTTNGRAVEPVRPFAELPALPDDLADAFESFKLAILRHKAAGWQDVSCTDLLRSLDALKQLATAPA